MNNISINKRYRTNPFIENLNIETATKRIVVSPLGKGNNILVNQDTGEQQGTEVTTYKKVDNKEFVKLFVSNIALTFELHSYGIKAFNVVMWAMQYSGINKDLIVLDIYTLEAFLDKNCLKMSIPTFRRGLNELVQAKIIAKSLRKGWYFINPNFIFNGDRIAFTTLIERDDNFKNNNSSHLDEKQNSNFISNDEIKILMTNKYRITEQKTQELVQKYSIEKIEGAMRKIDRLVKINSWAVETPEKLSNYLIECIEKNITE